MSEASEDFRRYPGYKERFNDGDKGLSHLLDHGGLRM